MLCAEHELVRRKSLRFFLDSCTLQTYNEPVFSNLHPGPYYCHTVCENENCEVRDGDSGIVLKLLFTSEIVF